jgi:hypothetical protein
MTKIYQNQDRKERESKIMSYFSTKKSTKTLPKKKSRKKKMITKQNQSQSQPQPQSTKNKLSKKK